MKDEVFDIISVGIGPFNLGLAAMCDELPELRCLFFDEKPEFDWHAGMMLPNARLQVPFYADLVTVVNPCSRYTYLNYLKERKRLFRFAILENNFILRREYNDYCRWVVEQLANLRFGCRVVDVEYDSADALYVVYVFDLVSERVETFYTKRLVLGVGSRPFVPQGAEMFFSASPGREISQSQIRPVDGGALLLRNDKGDDWQEAVSPIVIHSSDYLHYKDDILRNDHGVSIIGSGQSAAEIFYDLLQHSDSLAGLHWFTRSERFYPMDYSKFALEMTSLDYIDHFYSLAPEKKKAVLREQDCLYKGINFSLIDDIYSMLYEKASSDAGADISLHPNVELRNIEHDGGRLLLRMYHGELEDNFSHRTDAVILATGYKACIPDFIQSVKERLTSPGPAGRDHPPAGTGLALQRGIHVHRNYSIDVNASEIFVQNAEMHTHGFSAPDLGMGPYRNATILNSVLGYDYFELERNVAFQDFGYFGSKDA